MQGGRGEEAELGYQPLLHPLHLHPFIPPSSHSFSPRWFSSRRMPTSPRWLDDPLTPRLSRFKSEWNINKEPHRSGFYMVSTAADHRSPRTLHVGRDVKWCVHQRKPLFPPSFAAIQSNNPKPVHLEADLLSPTRTIFPLKVVSILLCGASLARAVGDPAPHCPPQFPVSTATF